MLMTVADVLTKAEVAHCRSVLESAQWVDGKATAGEQSAKAKFNLQIPTDSPQALELGELILRALGRSPDFNSFALPYRVIPPLFNRYDAGMTFHAHVDNAIRPVPGTGMRIRTDLSTTLFLSGPDEYDGGELIIHDTYGTHSIKLPAGHMVVYPASSLHSVTPVTRGSRWASFFWSQSLIRDDGARVLLYEMDQAIIETRRSLPDHHPAVLGLTNCYHNLLRRWSEI